MRFDELDVVLPVNEKTVGASGYSNSPCASLALTVIKAVLLPVASIYVLQQKQILEAGNTDEILVSFFRFC